jgi:hypothetical protein
VSRGVLRRFQISILHHQVENLMDSPLKVTDRGPQKQRPAQELLVHPREMMDESPGKAEATAPQSGELCWATDGVGAEGWQRSQPLSLLGD